MELKRVVVTGIGAITPIGKTLNEYWEGLCAGRSGAAEITRFDSTAFRTRIACEVKGYEVDDYFDRKEARKYDLFSQYAMISADEAVLDSGITSHNIDLDEVGVIWASGIGGVNNLYEGISDYIEGGKKPRFNPFFIIKMIPDIPAGHISMKYGFRGANFATVSACASSANALIEAFHYIRYGKALAMVAGGSEGSICALGIGGFNSMNALSTRNDDPLTASRPFDRDRDGFVMGEGGGCIVIEEREHAIARGAKIYAEMVGVGVSGDAHHISAPHPDGYGAYLSMTRAIKDAAIPPESIDHINTHGTSTPLGDVAEVEAIKKTFGEWTPQISINATKSMTGHLLGGAGAVEAIAAIMALKHGIVPPTINHFNDDPAIDASLDFTFNKARKREIRYALSNAFGFGGHNATIVFKKHER